MRFAMICVEQNRPEAWQELSPPFGLLAACTTLRALGHDVAAYHLVAEPGYDATLRDAFSQADVAGFSVMTGPTLPAVVEATRLAKKAGCRTFWGGPHPTLLPEISLGEPALDAALRGEAEATLEGFCRWLDGKADSSPGLCVRDGDGVPVIAAQPPLVAADATAGHAFDLLPMAPYLRSESHHLPAGQGRISRALPYMTSKGCPLACAFCYNGAVNERRWRGYPLGRVFSEMDMLIDRFGVEGWYFYDDNFFVDMDRAWRILERYRLPSFVEVHSSRVTADFVRRAQQANVARVYLGGETGSDRILRLLRKGQTVASLCRAVERCSEAGLPVEVSMMIFLPGETAEELEMTFQLCETFNAMPHVSVDGPKAYNPYPGTELYRTLEDQLWTTPQNHDEWARVTRRSSPLDIGFSLSDAHRKVLARYAGGMEARE